MRTVKEQFKVYRFQVEGKYGAPLLPTSPVWTWTGRHVAWVHDRLHAMPDGRTPYELYADVAYKGELFMFGETVFLKEAISKTGQGRQHLRVNGADTAWRKGIWAGRTEDSNEHIVLTELGTRMARTVRLRSHALAEVCHEDDTQLPSLASGGAARKPTACGLAYWWPARARAHTHTGPST